MFLSQGKPGVKGEAGLTVSLVTFSRASSVSSHVYSCSHTVLVYYFQREDIIRMIKEICGKVYLFHFYVLIQQILSSRLVLSLYQ